MPRSGVRSRRRRFRVPLVLITVLLGTAWLTAGYVLLVRAPTDRVSAEEPADAVVALGGRLGEDTVRTAHRLAEGGAAPVLVISRPYTDDEPAIVTSLCDRPSEGGPSIICVPPDPSTTRGEAAMIQDLAELHGWDRVAVVTPTYHLARARLVIARCYRGELAMVNAQADISAANWAYYFVYQTGGFAKALLGQRGC